MRAACITIDQRALTHNLNRVKQLAPQSHVLAMVKANAYGHGVEACLTGLQAADAFGVACLEEALALRDLGVSKPIGLIEGVFAAHEMPQVLAQQFECVIHHAQQLKWLLQHAEAYAAQGLKAWVKLNSGMNRLGFQPSDCIAAIQRLQQRGVRCVLTMHFANADVPEHPLNPQQIQHLFAVKQACPDVQLSCCNSAAIFNWPELHFDYVRPGIMLYGASPFAERNVWELGLKPVMQLHAQIIAIQHLQTGDVVGYGSTFTATQAMRIAIVGMGYGDGYPRAYVSQNYVAIHGQLCALVGRVSMDMLAVDISHLEADIGDTVELWGNTRLVDDVAAANGTIGYELLCRSNQRPQRRVIV